MLLLKYLITLLFVTNFKRFTLASTESKRLYDDLLKKSAYDKLIRPVTNTSDILLVNIGSYTILLNFSSYTFGKNFNFRFEVVSNYRHSKFF